MDWQEVFNENCMIEKNIPVGANRLNEKDLQNANF